MWGAALCAVASCSSDLGCVRTTAGPAERSAPVASTALTSALSVRRRLPESLGYFGRSHRIAQHRELKCPRRVGPAHANERLGLLTVHKAASPRSMTIRAGRG